MITDESTLNKQSGYYVTQNEPSKVKQKENDSDDITKSSLMEFPWDNDSFSLCLESFPSTEISVKKFNRLPATASPLRMQWLSPNDSSEGEDSSQGSVSVSTTTNDSTKISKRKTKLTINSSIDNSFPYINDDAFLDRIQPAKKKQQKQKKKSGRIEHISPLMNSSNIFDEQDILFKSVFTKSVVTHSDQSQISNAGSIESWKVAQSPATGMKSSIILPSNTTIHREHYTSGSSTPHSYHSTSSPEPFEYNNSIRSIGINSISASGIYYTPPGSVASFRSKHVLDNSDNLIYYSDSMCSATSTEKRRSYSQFFNPAYQESRSKKSIGLFTKLMKNFKHHFAK